MKIIVLFLVMLMLSACGKTESEHAQTALAELTIAPETLAEYRIVYPEEDRNAKLLAHWLANEIVEESERVLQVVSDAKEIEGKEILVGTTNRSIGTDALQEPKTGNYVIDADETYICVRGQDAVGDYYAVKALMDTLLPGEKDAPITIVPGTQQIPESDTLAAMTFNIFSGDMSEQRSMSVIQTILNHLPDTIGVQEATEEWMSILEENLGGLYDYVGIGRDGEEGGEYSAVLYRKDRFQLQESGTKWLSDTPDVVSRYEASKYNRIFTYAVLAENTTDTQLLVINTHLDHMGSREEQAEVLIDFIEDYSEYPVILTGDFNAEKGGAVYRMITKQLQDSAEIAKEVPALFGQTFKDKIIDFVFVSEQNFEILKYDVIYAMENDMIPSDHRPVVVEYKLK